jgi:hypothetical protein
LGFSPGLAAKASQDISGAAEERAEKDRLY